MILWEKEFFRNMESLEGKFTKEGLPIVEDEFQKLFFFDLQIGYFIDKERGFKNKLLKEWSNELERENEFYWREIVTFSDLLTQDKEDQANIWSCNIIGIKVLREQGGKILSFLLPSNYWRGG